MPLYPGWADFPARTMKARLRLCGSVDEARGENIWRGLQPGGLDLPIAGSIAVWSEAKAKQTGKPIAGAAVGVVMVAMGSPSRRTERPACTVGKPRA